MSAGRPRRALARTIARGALALAAVGGLVALLEVAAYLGWVDWGLRFGPSQARRFTHSKPWANPFNVRDDELLFRHRPGLRFRGETPGDLVNLYGIATEKRYVADVAYDANGFRNPADLTRADVVLIGDSFVEAGLVGAAELVSTRLAAALGQVTANLGHSGYGPQQELIVLRRYGLPLAPKAVVWFFFEGNDLLDAGRYEDARRGLSDLDPQTTVYRQRSLVRNVAGRIGELFERMRTEDAPEAKERCGMLKTPSGAVKLYFAFGGKPLTPAEQAFLEIAKRSIGDAAAECARTGARFLVAYAPTKFRVHEGLAEFAPDSLCAAWKTNDLPARLATYCAGVNIELVDLAPGLRAAAAAGELVYFDDDDHWNAKGHEVIAGILAERLRP